MDSVEFFTPVISDIPDRDQVMIRCYDLYFKVNRGEDAQGRCSVLSSVCHRSEAPFVPAQGWARARLGRDDKQVYEVYVVK